jgi:hypothetical protein
MVFLACVLTPLVHDFIKPYRLRVDVVLRHTQPTALEIYYSTNRKNPNYFAAQDNAPFLTRPDAEQAPPLTKLTAYIASRKPVTQLRFDPSTLKNSFAIESLSIHSLVSDASYSAKELEVFARDGVQIAHLKTVGHTLEFETMGNDAHFPIPVPKTIGVPTRLTVYLWYLFSWSVTIAALFLVKISLWTPDSRLHRHGAIPIRLGGFSIYLPVMTGRAYNLIGIGILGFTLIKYVGFATGMDLSRVQYAFKTHQLISSIPAEVQSMKTITERQVIKEFVLASEMAKGGEESEIFNRATEYLYPIRLVARSEWVFARQADPVYARRKDCTSRDQQGEIILYACKR